MPQQLNTEKVIEQTTSLRQMNILEIKLIHHTKICKSMTQLETCQGMTGQLPYQGK